MKIFTLDYSQRGRKFLPERADPETPVPAGLDGAGTACSIWVRTILRLISPPAHVHPDLPLRVLVRIASISSTFLPPGLRVARRGH